MINEEKLAAERNDEKNSRPSKSQLLSNTDSMNVMICGTSVETFWDKTPEGSIDFIDKQQHQFLQSDGMENKIDAVTAQDDHKHKEKQENGISAFRAVGKQ